MTLDARYIVEVLLGDREAIRAAAIRFPDGTIYEGSFHAECWLLAYSMGKIAEDPSEESTVDLQHKYSVEEGFTTTFNRFVDRHIAFDLSVASGQRPEEEKAPAEFDTQWLDSHDIADKYRNESMDEYGELAIAIDPRSYAKQTSEQTGRNCTSINYEWSAVPNGWIEPACIKVRFTVTNTLVDNLTSSVNPITGVVQTVGGHQYPTSPAAYIADQRGPGATNHLIGVYRAIKQIEAELVPHGWEPNTMLGKMDEILSSYEPKGQAMI